MADTIITQVKKPEKKKKNGLFSFFCCCFQTQETPDYNNNNLRCSRRVSRTCGSEPEEYLLPPLSPRSSHKKTLVLDLDETLVHSSFKPISNAHFNIPVEIEEQVYQVYVLKRPGVDQFLKRMGELYEIVVFTASLAKYADPVLDLLDKHKVVTFRLFREACVNHKGNYVKDLGRMGRDINKIIIIDNSPASYMFNPENAVPVESWFDDENDNELLDLIPILEQMSRTQDVRDEIAKHQR